MYQPVHQPNIVLIMADQFAFDVIGALGHPTVKTPHIDRIVQSGVTFEHAYCNSPLCVPSRASIVTGKFVSNKVSMIMVQNCPRVNQHFYTI